MPSGSKILLPTEQQWQRAAQGNDSRDYPWGNDWDCKRCNNSVSPCDSNVTTPVTQNVTTPVTQYEGKGDSPFGVVDMAGNVWEWCLTEYNSGNNNINGTEDRVLRGGSWDVTLAGGFRCGLRDGYYPYGRYNNDGFRLALSY